jgi:cyclin T
MSQNLLLMMDVFLQVYQAEAEELTFNENVLFQTLGFSVTVEHPHMHIVRWLEVSVLLSLQKDEVSAGCTCASNKAT